MPKLALKQYCTGCTACASACPKACIAMTPDKYGFLCPVIDTAMCIDCGLCEKTCPVIAPAKKPDTLPQAFAAYSKDEAMRLSSSSGGVFTELAEIILKDGGAVFGAAYDAQFEVVHICAENEDELAKLRGAKYAQSDLQGIFQQVKTRLEQGQQVLFSGTPCQVAGLVTFLRKPYENLVTVDFVCHSVPSPMAWREYVKYRSMQDNAGIPPQKINLRSKETGWSRYQYSNMFEYDDEKRHTSRSGESLYMKLFVGGYINRESCENCRFKGYQRVSDLTIGDFWGVWDIAPEMDDNKGTSVVLIQSDQGQALWDRLQNRICAQEVSLVQASQQNSAMLQSSKANPNCETALENIRSFRIEKCETFFCDRKPSAVKRIGRKIKQLLINHR